jgi:hypothetical protein
MKSYTVYNAPKLKGNDPESEDVKIKRIQSTDSESRYPKKKYIQVTVEETRRAIIHAELPEGKSACEIQDILSNAHIDWLHFEKDSETIHLDTIVREFTASGTIPYLEEWNRLHEAEGE